jgi:hypothetical protein
MRTKSLCLGAAVLAAGLLASSAQSNVYSLNIVGYVNLNVPAGKYLLMNNPLDNGTNTLDSLINASNAPVNTTKVWQWNGSGYNLLTLRASGWSPTGSGTNVLSPGTGFFVQNSGASDLTVTLVGNVLTGTNNLPYGAGYSLIGSKVPKAGLVESDLGLPVVNNDKVWQWNMANQSYDVFTRRATGWGGGLEPSIKVGEGFFIQAVGGSNWVQVLNP